jgi:hypothetical protein
MRDRHPALPKKPEMQASGVLIHDTLKEGYKSVNRELAKTRTKECNIRIEVSTLKAHLA